MLTIATRAVPDDLYERPIDKPKAALAALASRAYALLRILPSCRVCEEAHRRNDRGSSLFVASSYQRLCHIAKGAVDEPFRGSAKNSSLTRERRQLHRSASAERACLS